MQTRRVVPGIEHDIFLGIEYRRVRSGLFYVGVHARVKWVWGGRNGIAGQ